MKVTTPINQSKQMNASKEPCPNQILSHHDDGWDIRLQREAGGHPPRHARTIHISVVCQDNFLTKGVLNKMILFDLYVKLSYLDDFLTHWLRTSIHPNKSICSTWNAKGSKRFSKKNKIKVGFRSKIRKTISKCHTSAEMRSEQRIQMKKLKT